MNWEAVAKPSIRWIITKVVFHESQLESKNKSIAGKGSALSMLIYHWLLILMFDNKTTSILFLFSLVAFSFCWGSPLHHFWLIKKKKGFIFTSRIKKKCPSSTILCEGNAFTNCFSDDFRAWSPALGKCIPLRARNIFFIQGLFTSFSVLPHVINHYLFKCHYGNWWCQTERWCRRGSEYALYVHQWSVSVYATVYDCIGTYVIMSVYVSAYLKAMTSVHLEAGLLAEIPEPWGKGTYWWMKNSHSALLPVCTNPLSLQPLRAYTKV